MTEFSEIEFALASAPEEQPRGRRIMEWASTFQEVLVA